MSTERAEDVEVPDPPDPFEPAVETLTAGSRLFRVFTAAPGRHVTTFNPGHGGPHRFSFFSRPPVPVLYAAETEVAAACASLLHDVPLVGGQLLPENYEHSVVGAVVTTRELRLAKFNGVGLRRLGVDAPRLTASPPRTYRRTVAWAQAAHEVQVDGVQLDGAVWRSARCNSDRAYIVFGDRVHARDLRVATDYGRVFTTGPDLDWLVDLCAYLNVDVLTRTP